MRTTQFIYRATGSVFFDSPKCRAAVPARDPLLKYALQQASLDYAVRSIRHQVGPQLDCPRLSLAGVVLDRMDGLFLLKVHNIKPQRSERDRAALEFALRCNGLRLLERDAREIRADPLFSNARQVWEHERYDVSLLDRLRISAALAEYGPQSIRDLEARSRPEGNVLAAACALACQNLLTLNIQDSPLGPLTVVAANSQW
ncbi:hypothetical protein AOQ71_12395 [Bradyrhizobium manausense]|uniref:TnsA endonuclease N-terminal domain-containing protein n=1 Tax=Bradyrhizobium manausense TaxID=989370 RepID=A0A0R3DXM2_9BRAD|nr:hypothetical protein AOQ71_12395 [Bradyrhizobium manausense]